jgi:hypothetical protein
MRYGTLVNISKAIFHQEHFPTSKTSNQSHNFKHHVMIAEKAD